MRHALFLLAATLSAAAPLCADTIYQANPQGKPVVIQRDAIVVSENAEALAYKHFDLKDRRVVKVVLSKGSLPYSVDAASVAGRQQIVSTWKRFGYTATVTDQAGKSTRVWDLYLDFYPPGGRGSLLESVPPRTNVPILIDGGGADEIDFSKIDRIVIQGVKLSITLRDGHTLSGQFLMPTDKPAEVRVLGITGQYNPVSEDVFDFSQPLARLKEIRFE